MGRKGRDLDQKWLFGRLLDELHTQARDHVSQVVGGRGAVVDEFIVLSEVVVEPSVPVPRDCPEKPPGRRRVLDWQIPIQILARHGCAVSGRK